MQKRCSEPVRHTLGVPVRTRSICVDEKGPIRKPVRATIEEVNHSHIQNPIVIHKHNEIIH
jgi:hypothetical protein